MFALELGLCSSCLLGEFEPLPSVSGAALLNPLLSRLLWNLVHLYRGQIYLIGLGPGS